MVSNRESKFIKSLQLKKNRFKEGCFLVEGAKSMVETLRSDLSLDLILATASFIEENKNFLTQHDVRLVQEKDLVQLGTLKSNNAALAVVKIPTWKSLNTAKGITLAFDRINDPGNLGTIIRIADWYGIEQVVCSPDSVDCFNPKTISATMGSFTRTRVYYQAIDDLLNDFKEVYAAQMNGESLYDTIFSVPGLIVFGSESHGLSQEVSAKVRRKVAIPGSGNAESLNLAVATAVFCDHIFRQTR